MGTPALPRREFLRGSAREFLRGSAKDVIAKRATQATDPTEQQRLQNIASSSLVFPTDEALSLLYSYRELKGETETPQWDGIFSKFTTG